MSMPNPAYVGRFAPTPSGHLHFGSLVAALASYLDARHVGGRWLVRMEDIDPPREMPGAQEAILRTLELHGLHWDGEVLRQSSRTEAYQAQIARLLEQGLAYPCQCSRSQLQASGGLYPGTCRDQYLPEAGNAIRLRVPQLRYCFDDRLQGRFCQHLGEELGDFVIRRRDGLIAYQLAVVMDDALQGITDVVRGADLLDNTPRQLYLQELLGLPQPRYLHLPLLIQPDGHKLGKRYRSPALSAEQASAQLARALRALGQQPPAELEGAPCTELLAWAVPHWRAEAIPALRTLAEAELK